MRRDCCRVSRAEPRSLVELAHRLRMGELFEHEPLDADDELRTWPRVDLTWRATIPELTRWTPTSGLAAVLVADPGFRSDAAGELARRHGCSASYVRSLRSRCPENPRDRRPRKGG